MEDKHKILFVRLFLGVSEDRTYFYIREMEVTNEEMKEEYVNSINYGPRYNYASGYTMETFPIPMSVDAYCKPEDIVDTKVKISLKAKYILKVRMMQLQSTSDLLNDLTRVKELDKPKLF